jgi:hypothetical protein
VDLQSLEIKEQSCRGSVYCVEKHMFILDGDNDRKHRYDDALLACEQEFRHPRCANLST